MLVFLLAAGLLAVRASADVATDVDRPSRALVSWGGPRPTIEFDNATLASWFDFGLNFSAISLPQVEASERAKWQPSNTTAMNVETRFFDHHCEAVAAEFVAGKAKECEDRCDYDYFVMAGWGTVPGMNFTEKGELLVTCGAIQTPKDCSTSPETCPYALIRAIGVDYTAQFVESMQSVEKEVKLIANASDSLADLVKELGVSTRKAIRPGGVAQIPNTKKKISKQTVNKKVLKEDYRKNETSVHETHHHEEHHNSTKTSKTSSDQQESAQRQATIDADSVQDAKQSKKASKTEEGKKHKKDKKDAATAASKQDHLEDMDLSDMDSSGSANATTSEPLASSSTPASPPTFSSDTPDRGALHARPRQCHAKQHTP